HIGSSYAIIGVDTLLTYLILTILIIITTRNFCVSYTAKTPRFWHGVISTTRNFCVSHTAKKPKLWTWGHHYNA
ncbi:hypothetical protein, partial [Yersinia pseudotuberculosis]